MINQRMIDEGARALAERVGKGTPDAFRGASEAVLRAALSGRSDPAPVAQMTGWTGNKCEPCKGHGVRMQDGEERRCPDCAGTGDEYGPKFPPDDFFDDKFDKPVETDAPLQAAARESGWALSSLVDEIKFEKRQQVVNIINRLSAALAAMDRG